MKRTGKKRKRSIEEFIDHLRPRKKRVTVKETILELFDEYEDEDLCYSNIHEDLKKISSSGVLSSNFDLYFLPKYLHDLSEEGIVNFCVSDGSYSKNKSCSSSKKKKKKKKKLPSLTNQIQRIDPIELEIPKNRDQKVILQSRPYVPPKPNIPTVVGNYVTQTEIKPARMNFFSSVKYVLAISSNKKPFVTSDEVYSALEYFCNHGLIIPTDFILGQHLRNILRETFQRISESSNCDGNVNYVPPPPITSTTNNSPNSVMVLSPPPPPLPPLLPEKEVDEKTPSNSSPEQERKNQVQKQQDQQPHISSLISNVLRIERSQSVPKFTVLKTLSDDEDNIEGSLRTRTYLVQIHPSNETRILKKVDGVNLVSFDNSLHFLQNIRLPKFIFHLERIVCQKKNEKGEEGEGSSFLFYKEILEKGKHGLELLQEEDFGTIQRVVDKLCDGIQYLLTQGICARIQLEDFFYRSSDGEVRLCLTNSNFRFCDIITKENSGRYRQSLRDGIIKRIKSLLKDMKK